MQKNMIFSSLNNALTETKDIKMQRNNLPIDEYDFKKYNTLLEIKKELNEEAKNDNHFVGNNNLIMNRDNIIKYNSYKGYQNSDLFHKNLNSNLEKNIIKLQRENIINNKGKQNDYDELLNRINPNISKNKETNDEIEILKNKISQYESSLENTRIEYQKQINFYIQQLSNYNVLITIITNFFKIISTKYIPNYNFNIPNHTIEPNNFIQLNQKDFEEKFNKIIEYINDLHSELEEYKNKDNLVINKNIDVDKNELDKFIQLNNNINDSFPRTNINNNYNYFSEGKDFIFKNEILSKKVRSKSSMKPKVHITKKLNDNKKNLFKNKDNKNNKKLTKRNNSYRVAEKNNNLDIVQYTKKKKKTNKDFKNIPIKSNKKSKSKTDIKSIKSINLK